MEDEQERIRRGSEELDKFMGRNALIPQLRQFWKDLRYTWPDKRGSSASKNGEGEPKG
ncbi:hypothetical protein [Rhizobium fabae]|uniref:Uncharacterized protein n=1 Tax=Rhizobium fabae TaxID=573179 RepID=A0A7W6FLL8_9HYPH|nr:hypothetical protein [Rhizobium fabae]MBB3918380.1 hypothetical protein [Rhizobium fabae]